MIVHDISTKRKTKLVAEELEKLWQQKRIKPVRWFLDYSNMFVIVVSEQRTAISLFKAFDVMNENRLQVPKLNRSGEGYVISMFIVAQDFLCINARYL